MSDYFFLFFAYSFLGWIAETVVATVKGRHFANRGFASGPFCFIYGFSAVVIALTMQELVSQPVFLFLGSMLLATNIEWFSAKILERMHQKKWWDYSGKRWNYDGYICLEYSVLWGILGACTMLFGNRLLLTVFHLLPGMVRQIVVLDLVIYGVLDGLVSVLAILHMEQYAEPLFYWSRVLKDGTYRLGYALQGHVERRITRAYPSAVEVPRTEEDGEGRLGFFKLLWIFTICSFLGDIVETIYCRLYGGVWMSRSSLVWGPFSIVWGMALVMATILLHRDRKKSDGVIFLMGTVMGGVYEYVCSVLAELVFGVVFWDYSGFKLNLGGRINLLYCFFWGIAAVCWIKLIYPRLSGFVDWILEKTPGWVTLVLALFMAANMFCSASALIRYTERGEGIEAQNAWEEILDERFDDGRMQRIYPNMIER